MAGKGLRWPGELKQSREKRERHGREEEQGENRFLFSTLGYRVRGERELRE